MPTLLSFSVNEGATDRLDDEINALIDLICRKTPFLFFSSAHTRKRVTEDGRILAVFIELEGFRPQNNDSMLMMCNRINDMLIYEKLPFRLTTIEHPPLNESKEEAFFFYERLHPALSENAKTLNELKDNAPEVPDEFQCLLTNQIMDDPVHDIRSPQVYYERANIMYWLDQKLPRFMPDTKLPYDPDLLKTDYDLKQKITLFMSETIAEANKKKLNTVCEELKINETLLPKKLNLALHKATIIGDDQLIKFLVLMGADINNQDNEEKYTALHIALINRQFTSTSSLLRLGAKIQIPCIEGITSRQLISALNSSDYQAVKVFCDKLKLTIDPEYSTEDKISISDRLASGKKRKDSTLQHNSQIEDKSIQDVIIFSRPLLMNAILNGNITQSTIHSANIFIAMFSHLTKLLFILTTYTLFLASCIAAASIPEIVGLTAILSTNACGAIMLGLLLLQLLTLFLINTYLPNLVESMKSVFIDIQHFPMKLIGLILGTLAGMTAALTSKILQAPYCLFMLCIAVNHKQTSPSNATPLTPGLFWPNNSHIMKINFTEELMKDARQNPTIIY